VGGANLSLGTATYDNLTGAWTLSISAGTLVTGTTYTFQASATHSTLSTPALTNSQPGIIVDTTAPTYSISVNKSTLKLNDYAEVTITFSEAVNNLSLADIDAPNGTLRGLSQSATDPKVWTALYTTDLAGNPVASSGNTPQTLTVDTIEPTVVVTSNKDTIKAGETATLTFTFSEDVDNFNISDIRAPYGSITALVQTGTDHKIWTATYTPAAELDGQTSTISVRRTADTTDTHGNMLSTAGNTFKTLTIDTKPPLASFAIDGQTDISIQGDLTLNLSETVTAAGTANIKIWKFGAINPTVTLDANNAAHLTIQGTGSATQAIIHYSGLSGGGSNYYLTI
jgi:hypothetical protein